MFRMMGGRASTRFMAAALKTPSFRVGLQIPHSIYRTPNSPLNSHAGRELAMNTLVTVGLVGSVGGGFIGCIYENLTLSVTLA